MNKIKVGIDYDNLLFDTTRAWIDIYNRMTGNHLQESDITAWDMTKFVSPEHKELIVDLLNNKLLWQSVRPLCDSRMYMKMLSNDENVELYVITATAPQTTEVKMNLLKKEYQWFNMDNVIITTKKQMIDVDILGDDGQHNLIGGKYHKVLFSYPWNLSFNAENNGCVRVKDWAGFYKEIQRLVKARKAVEEITK